MTYHSRLFKRAAGLAGAATIALVMSAGTVSVASAKPATLPFGGAYTITYLSGPSHTATATQCLVFSPGSILGFPKSGTWVATTFGGFAGNYVFDGKDLRFYGTFGGGSNVISHHAKKALHGYKGGFDDFTVSGPGAVNDGKITLTRGCADAGPARVHGADPTRPAGSARTVGAPAVFSGPYTLNYFSGPSHTFSATQCLVFTHSPILGFSNSGSWVASTFAGFAGKYVFDGKDLRFYGTFGGGAGVIAHHAKKVTGGYSGGFDDFSPSAPPAATNDGTITLTPGCAAGHAHAATSDPAA